MFHAVLLLCGIQTHSKIQSFNKNYWNWCHLCVFLQLPNFAYSLAVAHFQLSAGKDVELAHHLLQNALIMFPSVLLPLLEKCGVQPDSRVSGHTFFAQAQNK